MQAQSTDPADAALAPSAGRTKVHLIAAVDQDGLVSSGGRLPWEFKSSGQIKRIADEVANHTVVVGYNAAIALGGKPPGRQIIVLASGSAQQRYSRTRRAIIESRPQGLWKGCEVARSVDEVFARCTNDSLYVMGGRKTFELFLPFATTVTCHVLQRALFADAPPSPSNLYFPPMVREATLVDVKSTTVDTHLATKREEWHLDPVTLPPTRAEAVTRVEIAKQASVQPAPTPAVRARPAAIRATTRATWFETTPVGAAVAKKVPPFQAASTAQATPAKYTRNACAALARAVQPVANSDDEALQEAIRASLVELDIASEMAAMQQHYQSMAKVHIGGDSADTPVDCRSAVDGGLCDDLLYYASDDDNVSASSWSGDLSESDDDEEDENTDCDADDNASSDDDGDGDNGGGSTQLVAKDGLTGTTGNNAKFDRWFHANNPNDSPTDLLVDGDDDDIGAKADPGLAKVGGGGGADTPKSRLGQCPFAHLLRRGASAAALLILGRLMHRDVVNGACAALESTRAIAELILNGSAATTDLPMPLVLARAVLSCLLRTRSVAWTLICRSTDCRGADRREAVGYPHTTRDDPAHANKARLYWTTPLNRPWPSRDMWTLVECAEMHGRDDVVAECVALFRSMDEAVRIYAAAWSKPCDGDLASLYLCQSMGLGPAQGRVCAALAKATWAPPMRVARAAAKCRSVQLATAALSSAARHVGAGISLIRDGHCVLRLLAPEPYDRCVHAAVALHIVSAIVSGLFSVDALPKPTMALFDGARLVDGTHALFDLVERTVCNEILPAINEAYDDGPAKPQGDPAYRAALAHVFGAFCCTLVSYAARPCTNDDLSERTTATRATCLLARLVRDALDRRRRPCPWLVVLWPEICGRVGINAIADAVFGQPAHNTTSGIDPAPAEFGDGDTARSSANGQLIDESTASPATLTAQQQETTEPHPLLDPLCDGDPTVSAHILSYLDARDMGALARASRRTFFLVARMITPRAGGRRPIVPGVCDRGAIYVAQRLDASALTTRSLDPLFDRDGNERDVQFPEALAMLGHACWRLPSIQHAVADLDRLFSQVDAHPTSGRHHNAKRTALQRIRDIESREWHIPAYQRVAKRLAAVVVEAVWIGSGHVASEALALTARMAAMVAKQDAGRPLERLCFASKTATKHATVRDAIVDVTRDGHARQQARVLSVGNRWYLARAVTRAAAEHIDAGLLHVACAMAVHAQGEATETGRATAAIILLEAVIRKMERHATTTVTTYCAAQGMQQFLDAVASCLGGSVARPGCAPCGPDLTPKNDARPTDLTSLSLRFFALCARHGPVSPACRALICELAASAL